MNETLLTNIINLATNIAPLVAVVWAVSKVDTQVKLNTKDIEDIKKTKIPELQKKDMQLDGSLGIITNELARISVKIDILMERKNESEK